MIRRLRATARDTVRAMRSRPLLVLVAIALTIGGVWWLVQRDPRVGTPRTIRELSPVDPSLAVEPGAAGAATGSATPPASLRDSAVDGELLADANGHFVPTPRTLALFDYFLSATGEEPAAQLRARIGVAIAQRLSQDAAREANAFLDRYLRYRADAAEAASDERLAASADLERRLQWLRELRRKHFGPELATTLFRDDERALEVAIEARRVDSDASLSETEKTARLEGLERQLPDGARRARDASAAPLRLIQAEEQLRARGGSDAELRALREGMVGAEATARLEERDRGRASWNERLAAYRTERDAVLADAKLDAPTREVAVEAVRAQRFDARERIRVRVIDEMEASPSH